MAIILTTLKKILFWSYDRGTWQYDIMCVLILAFVFFGPNKAFQNRQPLLTPQLANQAVFISKDDLPLSGSTDIEHQIGQYLTDKYGHQVTVSSIEPMMDVSGKLRGYLTQISADWTTSRQ